MGCGSGMTCWRRLSDWQKAGVWDTVRAYDSDPHRQELRERHIEPNPARRNEDHGSGLGIFRWVSERTLGWLHGFRRLRTRYKRRADIHKGFVTLAECLICYRIPATGDS